MRSENQDPTHRWVSKLKVWDPKGEIRDPRPGTIIIHETQDSRPRILQVGPGTLIKGETRDYNTNISYRTWDSRTKIQMNLSSDQMNSIYLQSYYKTTVAYSVKKFFFYCNKFDLYIHKTYIHICFLYFEVEAIFLLFP